MRPVNLDQVAAEGEDLSRRLLDDPEMTVEDWRDEPDIDDLVAIAQALRAAKRLWPPALCEALRNAKLPQSRSEAIYPQAARKGPESLPSHGLGGGACSAAHRWDHKTRRT